MTARARHRGHPIEWTGNKWVFTEHRGPAIFLNDRERPCTACGKWSDGPDYCLGRLPNVSKACCGHGHPEDAYFIFHNGEEVRGEDAVRLQECWIHSPVTPSVAIAVYLRVLDVEITYRLCQMCNTGQAGVSELVTLADIICRSSLDFSLSCGILEVFHEKH